MPARLPPDLLTRSSRESSRLLALSYLDEISLAEQRLGANEDADALHDFRVGLRRLRSALSAYREPLEGSVTGKMRRQIRRLARSTNAGRDIEVQLDWLRRRAGVLAPEDGPGYHWLLGRLEERKEQAFARDLADVTTRFAETGEKFRKALGILRIELTNGRTHHEPSFGEATGELIRLQVARVREELGAIRNAADIEQVHGTRIALKRLRYLIEPVVRHNRRARALVRRFKEAQDLLGEYHDLHVLLASLASLRAGLSADDRGSVEPGLITVARHAEEGAAAAFQRFQEVWGGELGLRILTRAGELGSELVNGPTDDHRRRMTVTAGPQPAAPESEGQVTNVSSS
jgi:CHAD domain-containing protein